jgi:hypothetical protein
MDVFTGLSLRVDSQTCIDMRAPLQFQTCCTFSCCLHEQAPQHEGLCDTSRVDQDLGPCSPERSARMTACVAEGTRDVFRTALHRMAQMVRERRAESNWHF